MRPLENMDEMEKMKKGPQFVRYFGPVLDALRALGNSGTPAEVCEHIAEQLKISDEELNKRMESGTSRYANQVAWAKFYLNKAGYLESSKRGVWTLTDKGINTKLEHEEAYRLFREVHKTFEGGRKTSESNAEEDVAPTERGSVDVAGHKVVLLDRLRAMPPSSFEKLCQRLLRESGFQQVEVTGRSGDGGIDGRGILQVNPLLSFQVIFQCKRYLGSIPPSQIRDFRGAMTGRADKGIFLTTGSFSVEARREASRDGAPPIELVDADKLVSMFEELELGLKPKTTFEIDPKFFEEFK
jgi:restriction system protein